MVTVCIMYQYAYHARSSQSDVKRQSMILSSGHGYIILFSLFSLSPFLHLSSFSYQKSLLQSRSQLLSILSIHNPTNTVIRHKMGFLSTTVSRPLLLVTRVMQWVSSVITMGLYAYFVHRQRHGVHIIYTLVISILSILLFIPAFVSPFKAVLSKFVVSIDFVFSYLYVPLAHSLLDRDTR